MDLELKGKIALVSGGSQGLGFASALQLAKEGAEVILLSRSPNNLQAAAQKIHEATGKEAVTIPIDVTHPDEIQNALQQALEQFGGIDILLANAGGPPFGTFLELTDDDFYYAFELNFMSTIRLIRGVIDSMKARKGGRIGIVVSQSAKEPIPGLLLSNSIRPGIVGLAKTLSGELANNQILVNCFAPGRIQTTRSTALDQANAQKQGIPLQELQHKSTQPIPLGRYGDPEEFGKVVTFYLSFANTYVTGQTIVIDGGKGQTLL